MGKPLFAVENFFNRAVFPDHTISADEDTSTTEAFRVGNGRRAAQDYWQPVTTGTEHWVKVGMDQQRAFDYLALDRGHNLDGVQVTLEASNDDSTWWTVVQETLPTSVANPGDLNSSPGAKTQEGAYLRRFTQDTAQYVRLRIAAIAGDVPQIVGLFVGQSYEPNYLLSLPFSYGGRELIYRPVRSDTAWTGTDRPAQRYRTNVNLRLSDYDEYDTARYHIETLLWRRRPAWYLPDQARTERAWMAVAPPGGYEFAQREGWSYMQSTFPLVEHEPELV